MKKRRKSPLKRLLPYVILGSIVLGIWLCGYVIGRAIPRSTSVENELRPITTSVSAMTVTEDKPCEEWLDFKATAYCACSICCDGWAANRPVDEYGNKIILTASGERAIEGVTIAADWSVLPKGTKVEIQGYGTYVVQDKGGSIKGNRIDIYFSNHQAAKRFGMQNVKLQIVK